MINREKFPKLIRDKNDVTFRTKRGKKVSVFERKCNIFCIFRASNLVKILFSFPRLYHRDDGGAAGYSAVAEHCDQSCQANSVGSRILV